MQEELDGAAGASIANASVADQNSPESGEISESAKSSTPGKAAKQVKKGEKVKLPGRDPIWARLLIAFGLKFGEPLKTTSRPAVTSSALARL